MNLRGYIHGEQLVPNRLTLPVSDGSGDAPALSSTRSCNWSQLVDCPWRPITICHHHWCPRWVWSLSSVVVKISSSRWLLQVTRLEFVSTPSREPICAWSPRESKGDEKRWISTGRCGRLLGNVGENWQKFKLHILLMWYYPSILMKKTRFDHPVLNGVS